MTTTGIIVAVLALAAAFVVFGQALKRSEDYATEDEATPLDESRARQSMLDEFAQLSPTQKRIVRRTVRRGQQVSDASLAAAAVKLAQLKALIQRRYLARVPWVSVICLSILGLITATRVFDADEVRPFDVVALVWFAILVLLMIRRPRWPLRHAEEAERRNRALLPLHPGTPSNPGREPV